MNCPLIKKTSNFQQCFRYFIHSFNAAHFLFLFQLLSQNQFGKPHDLQEICVCAIESRQICNLNEVYITNSQLKCKAVRSVAELIGPVNNRTSQSVSHGTDVYINLLFFFLLFFWQSHTIATCMNDLIRNN